VLFAADNSAALQFGMNALVDLHAGTVAGGNYRVSPGDFAYSKVEKYDITPSMT
jgi:hypothetical protein